MTEHLDVNQAEDQDLQQRRNALLVPAIIATCVGLPLITLSVVLHVFAWAFLHSHPDWATPPGTTYLPPSESERAMIVIRAAAPVVAGLGFLFLTWRFRNQGRRAATGVCAVAVVLMGIAALW